VLGPTSSTAHDGFTLRDLVSYDGKHNEASTGQWRRIDREKRTSFPHMTAWRSTPGSAQERCARRALVNSLDGSVGTSAAAETQPGTTLPCRDDLLRGLKEVTMAAVEPVSGIYGRLPCKAVVVVVTSSDV
jgi:hypothetical protein